jgi:hypothetical protein
MILRHALDDDLALGFEFKERFADVVSRGDFGVADNGMGFSFKDFFYGCGHRFSK